MINFSTGPVAITQPVIEALNSPVIAHRSQQFNRIFRELIERLSAQLGVRKSYVLTGSGTMANDMMLYQIKARQAKGLILVNGIFGERLRHQAKRLSLNFNVLEIEWGSAFKNVDIQYAISHSGAKWILACHCETSTGVLLNLAELCEIAESLDTEVFLDCMSTFGTMLLPLQKIAMATASTAKGIGSLAGLALVFSNIELSEQPDIPIYLDLQHAEKCNGVPFTISSNLVLGLLAALKTNNEIERWNRNRYFGNKIYDAIKPTGIVPFASKETLVFTLVIYTGSSTVLAESLKKMGILVSYESEYLKSRNWLQIALFGNYLESEIDYTLKVILQEIAVPIN